MKPKVKQALAGTAVVAVVALGATVPAMAQVADSATEETTREEHRPARDTAFAEALAAELDVDADTVAAAIDKVREDLAAEREAERLAELQDRLDAAVEAGELTQEQADALLEAQEAGVLPGLGMGGPGGHRGGPPMMGVPDDDTVADDAADSDATAEDTAA